VHSPTPPTTRITRCTPATALTTLCRRTRQHSTAHLLRCGYRAAISNVPYAIGESRCQAAVCNGCSDDGQWVKGAGATDEAALGAHRMGRTQLCWRNPASRSTGRHLHDATVLVVSAKLPSRPAKSTGHILRTMMMLGPGTVRRDTAAGDWPGTELGCCLEGYNGRLDQAQVAPAQLPALPHRPSPAYASVEAYITVRPQPHRLRHLLCWVAAIRSVLILAEMYKKYNARGPLWVSTSREPRTATRRRRPHISLTAPQDRV